MGISCGATDITKSKKNSLSAYIGELYTSVSILEQTLSNFVVVEWLTNALLQLSCQDPEIQKREKDDRKNLNNIFYERIGNAGGNLLLEL